MIQQQWLLHVTRCKLRFDGGRNDTFDSERSKFIMRDFSGGVNE